MSRLLRRTINLESTSSYEKLWKTGSSDVNVELHPKSFFIHSDHSRHIPLCFIHANMFGYNLSEGTLESPFYSPALFRTSSLSTSRLVSTYSTPHARRVGATGICKSEPGYYFNNGLILDKEGVMLACCIDTDFLKESFLESINIIREKPFYKLAIENDVHNNRDIYRILNLRLASIIDDVLVRRNFNEHAVTFVHNKKIKDLFSQHNCDYDWVDTGSSLWGRGRFIADTETEWFNAQIFAQPEVPVFQDIDGPDKFVKEAVQETFTPAGF